MLSSRWENAQQVVMSARLWCHTVISLQGEIKAEMRSEI